MTDLFTSDQPLDDVETMIRLAQDYVCASDDLRPRVLETARLEVRERAIRRWFWLGAALMLFSGFVLTAIREQLPETGSGGLRSVVDAAAILSSTESAALRGDPSWGMVESFTQLRQRQAELLRL